MKYQELLNCNIEQILSAATPQQRLIWNYIFLTYGERVAINQIYWGGATGTEAETYAAGKMYFMYRMIFGNGAGAAVGVNPGQISLFDATNTLMTILNNNRPVWVGAANNYVNLHIDIQNLLFSRFSTLVYNEVTFVGYRLIFA
jgi:hypothetical protein